MSPISTVKGSGMPIIAGLVTTIFAACLGTAYSLVAIAISGGGSFTSIIETIRMVIQLGGLLASPVTLVLFPILAWLRRPRWTPVAGAIGGAIMLSLPVAAYMLSDAANGLAPSMLRIEQISALVIGPISGWLSGLLFRRLILGPKKRVGNSAG